MPGYKCSPAFAAGMAVRKETGKVHFVHCIKCTPSIQGAQAQHQFAVSKYWKTCRTWWICNAQGQPSPKSCALIKRQPLHRGKAMSPCTWLCVCVRVVWHNHCIAITRHPVQRCTLALAGCRRLQFLSLTGSGRSSRFGDGVFVLWFVVCLLCVREGFVCTSETYYTQNAMWNWMLILF